MPPLRLYTFAQVADRIGEVLGERPAVGTVRDVATTSHRGTNSRVRLTAGMPSALWYLVDGHRVFAARDIEHWLKHHPRVMMARHLAALRRAKPAARAAAVEEARAAGLSWQQIATELGRADGRPYTRQWAQQKFGASLRDE